jgi:hypothetical protein
LWTNTKRTRTDLLPCRKALAINGLRQAARRFAHSELDRLLDSQRTHHLASFPSHSVAAVAEISKEVAMLSRSDQIFSTAKFAAGEPAGSLAGRIKSIGGRIATWVDTCADYYAAAAIYEQLSALSDAELMRRGLSRATLAQNVRATCDRSFQP